MHWSTNVARLELLINSPISVRSEPVKVLVFNYTSLRLACHASNLNWDGAVKNY